jgi:hypothetical protein
MWCGVLRHILMTNDELNAARHESAHAVCAWALGVAVYSVEMFDPHSGCISPGLPDDLLRRGLDASTVGIVFAKIAVAGVAGSPSTCYSPQDNECLRSALWLSGFVGIDWLTFRDTTRDLVAPLLAKHQDKVDRVAVALVERGALSGAEFLELVEDDTK